MSSWCGVKINGWFERCFGLPNWPGYGWIRSSKASSREAFQKMPTPMSSNEVEFWQGLDTTARTNPEWVDCLKLQFSEFMPFHAMLISSISLSQQPWMELRTSRLFYLAKLWRNALRLASNPTLCNNCCTFPGGSSWYQFPKFQQGCNTATLMFGEISSPFFVILILDSDYLEDLQFPIRSLAPWWSMVDGHPMHPRCGEDLLSLDPSAVLWTQGQQPGTKNCKHLLPGLIVYSF